MTTSTVYTTTVQTIYTCAAEVTDCPYRTKPLLITSTSMSSLWATKIILTGTVVDYTTVCPVSPTATGSPLASNVPSGNGVSFSAAPNTAAIPQTDAAPVPVLPVISVASPVSQDNAPAPTPNNPTAAALPSPAQSSSPSDQDFCPVETPEPSTWQWSLSQASVPATAPAGPSSNEPVSPPASTIVPSPSSPPTYVAASLGNKLSFRVLSMTLGGIVALLLL